MSTFRRAAMIAALVCTALSTGPSAAAAASCAGPAAGGDWPSFGGDVQGTRNQPAEDAISADNVGSLVPAWTFSIAGAGGAGAINGTPVVAGGCVYAYTAGGWIFALNADDGAEVWRRQAQVVDPATLTVANGVVYISQGPSDDRDGLHFLALDASTGEIVVTSDVVASDDPSTSVGAVYFDGTVVLGVHNTEIGVDNTGGLGFVDAATGAVLKRTYTVPEDEAGFGSYAGIPVEPAEPYGLGEFAGCTVWSVAAVDPVSKHGYVGTAQPGNQPAAWLPANESDRCNAIVKFDLDRSRPTFGEIVAWRKGTLDDPPYVDVDFGGGGATVMNDAGGRQIVVQLQKSGWLHAAYTDSMAAAWSVVVGAGGPSGNYTAQATDGTNIFVVGSYVGQMFSVDATTGAYNWMTPVISPFATNPVAHANGVVYYADEKGVLNGLDAATGLPLLARPIAGDAAPADCVRNQSGGVSVARHTVFAGCGSAVVAYGLPG